MDRAQAQAAIEFGRFQVLPHRREVLAEGRQLELGGRAFDVLMALIEASGAVVSKDTLMNRVWPHRIVEENNLQAQIATLRRAFGADRDLIRTIAGRGYQFTGEIRALSTGHDAQATAGVTQPRPTPSRPPTNLLEPVSELVGRDAELDEILDLSTSHRLLTLVGAGGIGKTRLAFEVARHVLPRFADGVWAIELAPLSDPELVPVTVATTLGLELPLGTASPLSVANALRSKQLMLVLDNCEHVVDATARMAESLLRANPEARVIATSREPLRVEGEWIYPVPPLAVPAEGSPDGEDRLRYGAVRLFVVRASAAMPSFSPDPRVTAAIAGICRRLDGIPLAIELAAARTAAFGVDGVGALLDDRFRLLTGGHRTALPRHQTLRATLDWSYELLTEPERVVLRRLAIFAGSFSLDAASAVARGSDLSAIDVVDHVARLASKSLVAVDVGGREVNYQLLETMRAYATGKLIEAGEFDQAARCHAEYYRDLVRRAKVQVETQGETAPPREWPATRDRCIDNIRIALDWCFGPKGDLSLGIALTIAAIPLWIELTLMDECRERVERALDGGGPDMEPRTELQLQLARGQSLIYTRGTMPGTGAVWSRALELADEINDRESQLGALWGLWVYHIYRGEHSDAQALVERFRKLARDGGDPELLLMGDRMLGVLLHYLGDQTKARSYIERVVNRYVAPTHRSPARFLFDQRATALVNFARILWLQGFYDQATRTADAAVEEALAIDHAMSLCYALADAAAPIALRIGDGASAHRFIMMLLDQSTRHGLALLHAWGRCLKGVKLSNDGDPVEGATLLRSGLDEFREVGFALRYTSFLGELALAQSRIGQLREALGSIEEAIELSEQKQERWCIAELLRVKGELLRQMAKPDIVETAEACFRQALDCARLQGALSWEVNAAAGMARLWHEQGRTTDARELLAPIYGRFTEGFASPDLKAARELIDALQ
jgi:predicted ATPase/DNA-binding winged helix-turn-helix (wHTH) protein